MSKLHTWREYSVLRDAITEDDDDDRLLIKCKTNHNNFTGNLNFFFLQDFEEKKCPHNWIQSDCHSLYSDVGLDVLNKFIYLHFHCESLNEPLH